MEETCRFRGETTAHLANYKEFTSGYTYAAIPQLVIRGIGIAVALLMLFLLSQVPNASFYAKYFLIFSSIYLAFELIQWFATRNGNIHYKRTLMSNNGMPPVNAMWFAEDAIHCSNPATGSTLNYTYDQIKWIFETKHLLVPVMKLRLCLIIDKRTLSGGTIEEFKEYLLSKCPNIKRKKVRSCTFGKWLRRTQLLIMVLFLLLSLTFLLDENLPAKLTGQLHNDMRYQEIVQELSALGITITEQTVTELETYDADYLLENGVDYYSDNPYASKVFDVLCWEGAGVYDELTWEWTPSSSGVYWFDTEIWNVTDMYTAFFTGLSAMDEELAFSNISEDYSAIDPEAGTGNVPVSFDYRERHYQLTASYNGDWFDVQILYQVGLLLAADESENDLYYTYDGQAIMLYYGTAEQVQQFKKLTDIKLYSIDQLDVE